jgi:hypothetical protein
LVWWSLLGKTKSPENGCERSENDLGWKAMPLYWKTAPWARRSQI